MAEYIITSPDGRKFRVSGNGSAEDALAAFQAQYTPTESGKQNLARTNPAEYDSSSPEYQAKYGPTAVPSGENFSAAVGRVPVEMWRGLKQMGANVADAFSPSKNLSDLVTGVDNSRSGQVQREIDEARMRDAPLMKTKAGKAGSIVGGVGFGAPAMMIPGANTALGATLVGAGIGGVQPVASGESRFANTALGGAGGLAGYGLGQLVSKVASRAPTSSSSSASSANVNATPGTAASGASVNGSVNASGKMAPSMGTVGPDPSAGLNSAMNRAMTAGKDLGFKTTPGQATGSRALQQLEAKLESQPMTSGPFNSLKSGNQSTMNKVFAKALGESSDVLDDATVGKFLSRADKVYEDVADDAIRQIDANGFLGKLSQVEAETEGLIPGGVAEHPLVKRLIDYAAKGEVTGQQAQQLRSQIGKAAQQQMTTQSGNRELGKALFEVQDIADDWLAQGLSGDRLKSLNAVRQQYRAFRLMTKAGAINPSSGNVSGAKLANTLSRADEKGFLAGRNQSDLYNAARFAQAFRPIVGDSGTATRMPQGAFEWSMSVPLNMAARAYASSPAVNVALRTQAAAQAAGGAAGNVMRPLLKPLAPYAPIVLPPAGGLFGAYAAQQ